MTAEVLTPDAVASPAPLCKLGIFATTVTIDYRTDRFLPDIQGAAGRARNSVADCVAVTRSVRYGAPGQMSRTCRLPSVTVAPSGSGICFRNISVTTSILKSSPAVISSQPPVFRTLTEPHPAPVAPAEAAVAASLQRAKTALLAKQHPAGYWVGELQGDSILESEYILLMFILRQENDPQLIPIARYLRSLQQADGGWAMYPAGAPGCPTQSTNNPLCCVYDNGVMFQNSTINISDWRRSKNGSSISLP